MTNKEKGMIHIHRNKGRCQERKPLARRKRQRQGAQREDLRCQPRARARVKRKRSVLKRLRGEKSQAKKKKGKAASEEFQRGAPMEMCIPDSRPPLRGGPSEAKEKKNIE